MEPSVATWSAEQKLTEVLLRRLPRFVGPAVGQQIAAMFTPEAIAALWAVIVIWVGLHGAGGVPGLVADIVIIGGGVVCMGLAIVRALEEFLHFAMRLSSARSSADLDAAARHLANVLTLIGIEALLALLMKVRPRGAVRGGLSPEAQQLSRGLRNTQVTVAPEGNVVVATRTGQAQAGTRAAVLPSNGSPKVLNVGCGKRPMKDAINMDVEAAPGVDIVGDARSIPLAAGSIETIVAEAIPSVIGSNRSVAAEMFRVLRSGGRVRLHCRTPFGPAAVEAFERAGFTDVIRDQTLLRATKP